jgi:hypothetical protein
MSAKVSSSGTLADASSKKNTKESPILDKEVDFLVKLRDAACLIKDACEEQLEKMAPPGASPTGSSYDVNKIQWQTAQGTKGPYEKTDGDNSPDYKALLQDLKSHKGKMNIGGSFYWLFENGSTIGRKSRVV